MKTLPRQGIDDIAREIVDFVQARWQREGWDARTVALALQSAAAAWSTCVLKHLYERGPLPEQLFEAAIHDFRLVFLANAHEVIPHLMPAAATREYETAVAAHTHLNG